MSKYEFNPDSCVFIGDCKKYNTPECKDPCWRNREFQFLLNNSNLPEKHKKDTALIPMKEDLDVFEYLDYVRENIVEFVQQGYNLIIMGSPGNGKTVWSTKLIRRYIMEVSINNGFRQRALFVNLPNFITDMRHSISNHDDNFDQLRESMYDIDLLVLDDLGAVSLKNDFIHDEIYSIINYRIDNELCNIYTTNLSIEELEYNLSQRLSGRIIGSSEIVEIKNKMDLRKTESKSTFSFENFVKDR